MGRILTAENGSIAYKCLYGKGKVSMKNYHLRVTSMTDFNEEDFARYKAILAKIMASETAPDELEEFGMYVERDAETNIKTIYEVVITEMRDEIPEVNL